MKLHDYLRDSIFCILVNMFSMIGLSLFLYVTGDEGDIIFLILLFWIIILGTYLGVSFHFRKAYFDKLYNQLDSLDKKYLISEVMEVPYRADDRLYYEAMKISHKCMLEHISSTKREQKEYKEYIEQWIHEVKTPIAAMKLLSENNKSDRTRKLLIELEKTNHFVEQTLFFARSENVEKDYFIKEVELTKLVHEAIATNKQILLSNQVTVEVLACDCSVYTDPKWIEFILNQLISNSIKYKAITPLIITFSAYAATNGISLSVKDNGVGILASEINRIFDKGFTGANGRNNKHSTGIGLYLCKRLCDKLGIGIRAISEVEKGTNIIIDFPKGNFVKIQD